MNINKFVNSFSIISGAAILILGVFVALGKTNAVPENSGLLFVLGSIILIWGLIQKKRKGY